MSNDKKDIATIVKSINDILQRNALTEKEVISLLKKAKEVKKNNGSFGLLNFVSNTYKEFLTEDEIEKLQKSSYFNDLAKKTIELLISQEILTKIEANMLYSYLKIN